jgi:hypothetical protein
LIATVRVFVFSAAFPFFNNVDERPHVDLVVKYSHAPKRLSISRVTARRNISLSLSNMAGSIRPQIGFCRNDLFCGGASELCIARRVPRLVVDQF